MQVLENMAAVCGSESPPITPYRTSAPLRGRRGSSRKSCYCRRDSGSDAGDRSVGFIRGRSARIFGQMAAIGFASSAEAINVIRQFAKIDARSWARAMLPRLEGWRR